MSQALRGLGFRACNYRALDKERMGVYIGMPKMRGPFLRSLLEAYTARRVSGVGHTPQNMIFQDSQA